jgi:hypothetical protein
MLIDTTSASSHSNDYSSSGSSAPAQLCFASQNTASPPLTTHDSPLAPSANGKPRARQPWKPDGDAHLIYQWVKMEGKSQAWVASALRISQSTVSRVIQRYERWQAHAKEREGGRLDHAERLRAQRWLTFERNELILASCLRIANEMEGFIDTSKSTIHRPASSPSKETEIRTQHATIDRSGVAARFLRLAYRINMDQLKLAELDPPPLAPALSDEELAAEERQAAADAAELAATRSRVGSVHHAAPEPDGAEAAEEIKPLERHPGGWASSTADCDDAEPIEEVASTSNLEPETLNSSAAVSLHKLHILHNEITPEIAITGGKPCTCTLQARVERNSPGVCITESNELPRPPTADAGSGSQRAPSGYVDSRG